jgi:predicted ATPase
VAFRNADTPADEARDRDAETTFCGDVTKLQARFAETGGEIFIERALPIGAAPLRVVTETSDDRDDSIRAPDKVRRL